MQNRFYQSFLTEFMKNIKIILFLLIIIGSVSCKKYLDVVPDYTATIDNAFAMRNSAKKYLFTCYSFLPKLGEYNSNFTLLGSREIFTPPFATTLAAGYQNFVDVAYGKQSVNDPVANYWDGTKSGTPLFIALRDCNIFLENIDKVPDISEQERRQWIAEVKTLKAYYHFYLLRMYGPIPVIRQNLPISADVNVVQVKREPVDSVVSYIVQLLDEAAPDLQLQITDVAQEAGRVTQPIALSIKAQALVLAASPLFNGNTDYANFKNKDGQTLVNTTFDATKWQKAAEACKNAIDAAHEAGHSMYRFVKPIALNISPLTQACLDIRGAITEDFNSETIWGFKNAQPNILQSLCTPYVNGGGVSQANGGPAGLAYFAANMQACELFYTRNGVPIDEDPTWDYAHYADTAAVSAADQSLMKPGFFTAKFNLNRENRFYADLAFVGSSFFYNQYNTETSLLYYTGLGNFTSKDRYSMTGYWPKKLVNYKNTGNNTTAYKVTPYAWPAIRLPELYLMYAEAVNESAGPSQEAYQYIDSVRARAGLKGVRESWTNYSNNPAKPTTKEGLRSIIQQETLIEFMFEGNNYWNARRWHRLDLLNRPVTGWDVFQTERSKYYRKINYFYPVETSRDFLSPIKQYNLSVNHNLVQNPMW